MMSVELIKRITMIALVLLAVIVILNVRRLKAMTGKDKVLHVGLMLCLLLGVAIGVVTLFNHIRA